MDGFQKLLFRTHDGLPLETVLIPLHKPGAVSVCLSSQVGCAMGCVFCATARMPARRNLETWEIVDQWVQARDLARQQGRRVTGAVFMGMGEPFLNYDRVLAAAELLSYPYGGSIARKAITISTVGLVPPIDRFTAEGTALPPGDQPGRSHRREKGPARTRRGPNTRVAGHGRRPSARDRSGRPRHADVRLHQRAELRGSRRGSARAPDRRYPGSTGADRRHRPVRADFSRPPPPNLPAFEMR